MGRKNRFYKNKPCAYCGLVTGYNEGEHAVPDCLYVATVDPTIQRVKVAACPACNDRFHLDEAYAKAFLTACGENLSPEREELWAGTMRGFYQPEHGMQQLLTFSKAMVPATDETGRHLVGTDGKPRWKIYPGKDERVMAIIRKIVRGMCVYASGYGTGKPLEWMPQDRRLTWVSDQRVWAGPMIYQVPPKILSEVRIVYGVPGICIVRASFQDDLPEVHSG